MTEPGEELRELMAKAHEQWESMKPQPPKTHVLDRFRRQKKTLVCPYCGHGRRHPDPWGGHIGVKRDGKSTRTCRKCQRSWLPANDPPDAGGPYVR